MDKDEPKPPMVNDTVAVEASADGLVIAAWFCKSIGITREDFLEFAARTWEEVDAKGQTRTHLLVMNPKRLAELAGRAHAEQAFEAGARLAAKLKPKL